MNISTSKFSSGCESGWTVYLDQSYISESEFNRNNNNNNSIAVVKEEEEEEEEEEEDLSMVSDASSGPPHCQEDDREDCSCENASSLLASNWACNKSAKNKDRDIMKTKKKKKKMMMVVKEKCKSEYHSCLDDTASSPVSKARLNKSTLSRKEALMEYSQGFSATHFKGESAFDNDFRMSQSSLAKGSASEEPGDVHGGN